MTTDLMPTESVEQKQPVEVAWTPSPAKHRLSGPAVAALLAAALGILTLALVNLGTEASNDFNGWVHGIGKLWMPGAQGIGPYSGKETLSLAVWIGSWVFLHLGLRRRDLQVRRWLVIFLVGIGIATTLLWPPVFGYLAGQ